MGISQKVMDFLWKLNPKGLTHFFWRNPLFFPHKILISSGPINRNPKTLYRIKCDVGASKNAGQAFSTPRLSSHFILYNVSGFRLFSPSNQDFSLQMPLPTLLVSYNRLDKCNVNYCFLEKVNKSQKLRVVV